MRPRNLFALVVLIAAVSASARAESQSRLTRACDVLQFPRNGARAVCHKKLGDAVEVLEDNGSGYLRVQTESCTGFASTICFTRTPVTITTRPEIPPAASSSSQASDMADLEASINQIPIHLGLDLGGDFLLAVVPFETVPSLGFGMGAGATFDIQPFLRWRFALAADYHILMLSRGIDGTGTIVDPSPANFTQRISFVTARFDAAFLMETRANHPHWWLEAGLEYLYALSATQTNPTGDQTAYPATDRPLLLLLGPAFDLPLAGHYSLWLSLRPYYNVFSSGGNRLFGLRLGVALNFGL